MATLRLTNRDDLGFVNRSDEDKTCSGGLRAYCTVIDDASVYFKTVDQATQDKNFQLMWSSATGFDNLPTGRIPAFYRALFIQRRFQNLANRLPTVGEMANILATVDGSARGNARVDDAWGTDTAIRITLGLPLDEAQQNYALQQKGLTTDSSGNIIDTKKKGGGSAIMVVVGAAALLAILFLKGRP